MCSREQVCQEPVGYYGVGRRSCRLGARPSCLTNVGGNGWLAGRTRRKRMCRRKVLCTFVLGKIVSLPLGHPLPNDQGFPRAPPNNAQVARVTGACLLASPDKFGDAWRKLDAHRTCW